MVTLKFKSNIIFQKNHGQDADKLDKDEIKKKKNSPNNMPRIKWCKKNAYATVPPLRIGR